MKEIREWILDPAEVDATVARAEKILRRAKAKGLTGGWSWKVQENEKGQSVFVVEVEPLKYSGWTFVGAVDRLPDGGAITRTAPSFEGYISEEFLGDETRCDHCQTKRRRRTQVIVESESGKKMLVGSTCVKDLLGWDFSPVIFTDVEGELGGMFEAVPAFCESAVSVLSTACAAVSLFSYAPSRSDFSTAQAVRQVFRLGAKSEDPRVKEIVALESAAPAKWEAEAKEILAAAAEWLKSAPESDYVRNIRTALASEWVYASTLGLVVSLVMTIRKEQTRAAKIAAELAAKAELEGDITEITQYAATGSKFEVKGKVVDLFSFSTDFGRTTIVTFSAEGFRFKWFASSVSEDEFEIGKVYDFKGSIKGLDTYKEKVSTLVTRCKFKEVGSAWPKRSRKPEFVEL